MKLKIQEIRATQGRNKSRLEGGRGKYSGRGNTRRNINEINSVTTHLRMAAPEMRREPNAWLLDSLEQFWILTKQAPFGRSEQSYIYIYITKVKPG